MDYSIPPWTLNVHRRGNALVDLKYDQICTKDNIPCRHLCNTYVTPSNQHTKPIKNTYSSAISVIQSRSTMKRFSRILMMMSWSKFFRIDITSRIQSKSNWQSRATHIVQHRKTYFESFRRPERNIIRFPSFRFNYIAYPRNTLSTCDHFPFLKSTNLIDRVSAVQASLSSKSHLAIHVSGYANYPFNLIYCS